MNRRVLLIDLDPAFRDTLTRLLNRYRVVVMTEPEPDRALALANADLPSLIVIGVDEPDKAGFRVFQKCKKGVLAKVPVILVTSTVSPEAFNKHRGLKLHADEYIDKRTALDDEVVAKIDNLIGLGDLQEEEIPVEDDIPMDLGEGDVIDETVGEDAANEFVSEHDMRTVGPNDGIKADSMIAAETDAAFDALLGGDDPPKRAPSTADVHADAVPELVPHHNRPDPGTVPPPIADAIPEPVPHVNRPSDALPAVDDGESQSQIGGVVVDPSLAAEDDVDAASEFADEEPVAQIHDGVRIPHDRAESSPAIQLGDDDMVALDDDLVEEIHDVPPQPDPEPARPSVHEQATVMRAHVEPEATVARTPIITDQARKSGPHQAVDLGLDAVAADADRDQSGVYDRKTLRKISELERQVTQLTTELERTRVAADSAAKGGGREAQFLNLRESNLAKDKELKQAKGALDAQTAELTDLREKIKVAQHAKATLEAKNSELEQRIFDSGDKTQELADALKAAAEQARALDSELAGKHKALAQADAQRAQLEADLASERANRAANASEAERNLRLEREQLLQRHQSELQAARDEGEQATEIALGRLKEELETAHGQALHEAIEELRRANLEEHETALTELERKHSKETVNLKADHAGLLTDMRGQLTADIERLKAELAEARDGLTEATTAGAADKAAAIAELTQKHAAELEAIEEEHTEARERDADSQSQTIAQMKAQLDRAVAGGEHAAAAARQELEDLAAQHEAHKGELHAQHAATLAELHAKHEHELGKLDADRASVADAAKRAGESHRAALAEAQAKHEAEIAEFQEAANREISELRGAVAAAKRAADEDAARHSAALEAAGAEHAKAVADVEAKHERALAVANGDFLKQKSVADAEHGRAIAAANAATEAARLELESAHHKAIGELSAERDKAVRELSVERDELKRGLSATRENLKRSEGELASAVQTIADRNAELRQHQAAIAERDTRIGELRKEIEALEAENASYQDQVLRAYQKIKSDEAMVARARKAMAIALTVLDDEGKPPTA